MTVSAVSCAFAMGSHSKGSEDCSFGTICSTLSLSLPTILLRTPRRPTHGTATRFPTTGKEGYILCTPTSTNCAGDVLFVSKIDSVSQKSDESHIGQVGLTTVGKATTACCLVLRHLPAGSVFR